MKLTLWTYEGPPHVGAMRIATAMKDLHFVLHAPQGDTYADLLFTMIERLPKRPPVTYSTFQARDLGKDTATLFKNAVQEAYTRFKPSAILVGASCTAELIQDDPGGLGHALNLPIPVIPVELPAYQKKENWGAAETFYQLVRFFNPRDEKLEKSKDITCNILGPSSLGFRNADDVKEISGLLKQLGVGINVVAPLEASVDDLKKLRSAHFNVSLYPEVGKMAADYLMKNFDQPQTKNLPYGVAGTKEFLLEVCRLTGISENILKKEFFSVNSNRSEWYSRSVDSNYLTKKRVFVFGDATHVYSASKVARDEFGFDVVGLGTYSREFAREIRELGKEFGLEAIISDDYVAVEKAIVELQPELILGTQMERHIAKKHNIPSAVISAPMHVQDFPCRYSPQMGFEGSNVLFDTWIHPLVMGLEEHLLTMFRDDVEFNENVVPSHLASEGQSTVSVSEIDLTNSEVFWEQDAEKELKKIPFFVRGKARRNTEKFAVEHGFTRISLDTLYDAKAHYAR